MAAERNHLSLSMASTLAPSQGSQQPQPTSHILQQQPAPNTGGIEGQDGSPGPAKRGPGRPKGSTKKSLEIESSSPPKLKRPVGRPRKDGRPAGSVPKMSRGPGRPRKNHPPDFAVNTFPQQQQQGDQEGWAPLSSMFNNYRLPKEGVPDASVPTAVNGTINIERHSASSGAANNTSPAQQTSKWFPPTPATTTATSSSSIANALTHPLSVNQHQTTNNSAQNSTSLTLTGNRVYEKSVNDVSTGPRQIGDASPSIPISQIASFILVTIYSLFSRQSNRILPLPRDLLSAYRAHLGHLSGSQAVAYTYLTTFWLPSSPLLFRMVLPRSGMTSKSSHRSLFTSNRPPPPSRGANNGPQYTNGAGDAQNLSRTPNQDYHYESHRFFYWDPFYLSLTGPLNCPVCDRVPLSHSGSVRTGPLRVFDLPSSSTPTTSAHVHAGLVPSTFYVIGMQYECSDGTCGTRLASWDPKIVNNLPSVIADELPVQLSSIQTEPSENRMGLSGDAVSRPLFTLVKTLAQMGTSQECIRNALSKMWDWSDCDKEDGCEGESEDEDPAGQEDANKVDNEKVVEMLFSSPYQRLWTAQVAGASTGISLVNGQRPAKRHKPNESGASALMPAPSTNFSSPLFGSQNSTGADGSSSGLAIQLQPPPDPRVNNVDTQNPRSQPQPSSRPQPPQPQLKPGQPMRPQPSPRTSLTHAHPSHIHTPSPIYPATSLPNSTTNSPQTGQGSTLALKRSIDPDQHHPPSGVGAPVPQAPGQAATQASPAQPQFSGLVRSSPFPHLRALQHPGHPPPQPHPHHHPSAPVRPEPPLHLHPSLAHAPSALARFNPQAALHPQQSMLTATSQTAQHTAPTQQQHPTPQRRVRHCVKCGRNDCKGKGGSQFCKNPCKDCNGMDCKGRNSKRPNATCREGW